MKQFWLKYIIIPRKIRMYHKLLSSDKYFTQKEYEYFGRKIYELRNFLKVVIK